MTGKLRGAVAPSYLALCLLLGGSVQGVLTNALLQLLGVAIIAWALLDRTAAPLPRAARRLGWIVALALLVIAVQLVPLPNGVWTVLPGRGEIADGFTLLGLAPGSLPLSLAPYDTLATMPTLLPPLALLAAIVRLGGRSSWLALVVVGMTVIAVMLGALQVAGPASIDSPWYVYPVSNFGVATGFFANGNHMATLLLIAIPFAFAIGAAVNDKIDDVRKRTAAVVLAGGAVLLLLIGVALNGSLAGLGLGLPVLLVSLLLIGRPKQRWVRGTVLAAGLAGLAGFAALVATPLNEQLVARGAPGSISTRQTILGQGIEVYQHYGHVGSGLGSFAKVYRTFEDPATVDRTFVNHAHNDYLELAIELGLPGILLLLLFLAWWGSAALPVLRSQAYDRYATAGMIGSAVVLVHSLVDFPLRTAAVASLFAACLALMIASKRPVGSKTDLRPARHLVVE